MTGIASESGIFRFLANHDCPPQAPGRRRGIAPTKRVHRSSSTRTFGSYVQKTRIFPERFTSQSPGYTAFAELLEWR
jgi:hypothetical protein